MASSINASTSGGGGVIVTSDATGNLNIQSGGSTVVAVTSAGVAVTGTLAASGAVTASTTLAVTGAITATAGINAPNTFGFKNRIINGGMNTDQRNAAASQTFTAAGALAYSVDRWYGYCTGANVTGQQVAGATTPTVTQNRYRFTGAASVTAVGFGQRIEQKNSYDLAGSTCTLSADLGISATLTTVTWTAYYATTTADTFGSLASPTVTSIATGTFTVGATVANFSANISIPAAATTGIQILFTVGALTAGLTWTIGNVQLEKGSTATSFDFRAYSTELAMCQRYYARLQDTLALSNSLGTVSIESTSSTFGTAPFSMRATPSSTFSGLTISDGTVTPAVTSVSSLGSLIGGVSFNLLCSAATLTLGRAARIRTGGVGTAYLDFSAEL